MTRKKKSPNQEVPAPPRPVDHAPPRPVPERYTEVPEEPMEACTNLGLAPNVALKRDRSPSPQLENKKTRLPEPESDNEEENDVQTLLESERFKTEVRLRLLNDMEDKATEVDNLLMASSNMEDDYVEVIQDLITKSRLVRENITAHDCMAGHTSLFMRKIRSMKEVILKQSLGMKALAAQVNKLSTCAAARESAPAPQDCSSLIPGKPSYKEAVKIPRSTPTILNA
jgi:hypothetical protein